MVQAAPSARPLRILFVEDDPVIGEATLAHLERHRYDAVWVTDGLEAWERFADPGPAPFDVVLCDVMLPGMDGVTLCRRVREVATTPFVLVSARGLLSGSSAGCSSVCEYTSRVGVSASTVICRRTSIPGSKIASWWTT